MGKKIILLMLLLGVVTSTGGCSDFDFHIRDEARGVKPAVILIGKFDIRNMNYDPYIADEFRDALKFEFFKNGYNAVSLKKSDIAVTDETEWAATTCSENKGDIIITGVISERESGFLANRETDTLITFTVYGKTGSVIGKGFYHVDESAGAESVRRKAAEKFSSELLRSFLKVK